MTILYVLLGVLILLFLMLVAFSVSWSAHLTSAWEREMQKLYPDVFKEKK